ncbi:MAG: DNA repair protein [Hirschia sp.]|nr:DNA repair protein [Hirschia sp.]MBF17701.1 DNA repair protein [Hirschia sp.]|tara:strand:+ start:203 stop:877 length:675 start_codon:yes stop_codon:yes gene_type:complete
MSRMTVIRAALMGATILAAPALGGCASAYYSTMEQFGVEKRQILVDRVVMAAESQEEAKEEFADALEAFKAVVDFDGGELEKTYDKLKGEYEDADREADRVRTRVKDVQVVAKDLFKEWRKELDQYESAALRRDSEDLLVRTEARYGELEAKMLAASASMEPVLKLFSERVLYLKHNLNARAIAALGEESAQIEDDVEKLIANMERSIAEADAFIAEMKGETTS